ncbi:EF-hand calcium-binding domain-containing protein 6-like isoform X2 [Limulus polyphemus]|uniref:EF-hand calcium-binding domain-containing protein 6-like isoform X2 n=1 Tax=Limulus polyphemus TaxID=6850 RepID=A0ABM1TE60_LIMPO|nr:EF-hand calcium-binding domain-containing protein 6-like isoform X2 [Limulus polyphemus]
MSQSLVQSLSHARSWSAGSLYSKCNSRSQSVSSQKTSQLHRGSVSDLSSISSFNTYRPDSSVHIDQIREQLCHIAKTKYQEIRQGFGSYDKNGTGKVQREQFKQVLRTFCLPITSHQFENLMTQFKWRPDADGRLNYQDILNDLTGFNHTEGEKYVIKRSVPTNIPVDELEFGLKQKISSNMKNIIRGIWLYDYNKDGKIQKEELRTVLENYCFKMTDEQFNRLWNRYDPQKTGLVSYKDFLINLGVNSSRYQQFMPKDTVIRALNWSSSLGENKTDVERNKDIEEKSAIEENNHPSIQDLKLEEIEKTFKEKVYSNSAAIQQAFQLRDPSNSGYLKIEDFHAVLNYFIMPMSSSLFLQLLERLKVLDKVSGSKISWVNFSKTFCQSHSPQKRIDNQSTENTVRTLAQNLKRCEIVEKLRQNIVNPSVRLKAVITQLNQNGDRQVTRTELRRAIECGWSFRLTEEEFHELMILLDPGHTNLIPCQNFLNIFEKNGNYNKQDTEKWVRTVNRLVPYKSAVGSSLTSKEVETYLREAVCSQHEALLKDFEDIDYCKAGIAHKDDVRLLLNKYALRLTEKQFEQLWKTLPKNEFDNLKYVQFLDEYKTKSDIKIPTVTPLEHSGVSQDPGTNCSVTSRILSPFTSRRSTATQQSSKENLSQENKPTSLALKQNILPFRPRTASPNNERQHFEHLSIEGNKAPTRPSSAVPYIKKSLTPQNLTRSASASNLQFGHAKLQKSRGFIEQKTQPKLPSPIHLGWTERIGNYDSPSKKAFDAGYTSPLSDAFRGDSQVRPPSGSPNIKDTNAKSHRTQQVISNIKNSENEALLNKYVVLKWRDIARKCELIDKKKEGLVKNVDLIGILQKAGIPLNDKDLNELLTSKFEIHNKDEINYWDFLRKFLLYFGNNQRCGFAARQKLQKTRTSVQFGRESPHLYKTLLSMREKVLANWRVLRHRFRSHDPQITGLVDAFDFRQILQQHAIHLNEEDIFQILNYYDPSLSGKISYNDFLRVFVKSL